MAEGIPLSIMEAIAYGIPIIATDVGGNAEIVKDTYGILLSSDPKYSEVRGAIRVFSKLTANEISVMKESAMKFYEEHFNSDRIRKEFFVALKGA